MRREATGNSKKVKVIGVVLCALLFAVRVSAEARQPKKVPRIGFLNASSPVSVAARVDAFRQGLRDHGYMEGKNIVVEYRHAEGKQGRLNELADELVRLRVEVIVAGARRRPRRLRVRPRQYRSS
jgi:putative ABC transport system substrate-binding protein